MSTTSPVPVEHEVVGNVTPVRLDADSLESTAPEYLHDLKTTLAADGYAPVDLAVTACFDEDCSLATQSEAERIRSLVRAASFLGANRLTVAVEEEPPTDAAETALAACAERAGREGLTLEIDGPVSIDD